MKSEEQQKLDYKFHIQNLIDLEKEHWKYIFENSKSEVIYSIENVNKMFCLKFSIFSPKKLYNFRRHYSHWNQC